jgi:hypothetical protein
MRGPDVALQRRGRLFVGSKVFARARTAVDQASRFGICASFQRLAFANGRRRDDLFE